MSPATNIDFSALDVAAMPGDLVRQARVVWADRVRTEYQSIQLAARFLNESLASGEELAVQRRATEVVGEELRHTELCTAMCRALGGRVPAPSEVAAPLADLRDVPIDERLLASCISLFVVAETFSVAYLHDLAARATHPVTKAVLQSIAGDEVGHESFGIDLVSRKLRDVPPAKRAAWRAFTERLVRAHLDRAERVLAPLPESEHELDKWPELERASLGLLGDTRLALICEQTYRKHLGPRLRELGLG